jgi:hypothetical protein
VSLHRRRTAIQLLFDQLNAELFDGQIAPSAVRRAHHLARAHGCDGLFEPQRRHILIQSGLSPRSERRVLLHEMCHARLPSHHGHGRPFLAQLRRLGRRGERWALREADRYVRDPWLQLIDNLDRLDYHWHRLPSSASHRRQSLLKRAEQLLARL